jgi:energy-coupling factor transporter ATP-binding protein EcfA2
MLVVERQRFLDELWDYKVGEHVTFLGRTGGGKTTLKVQLIHALEKTFPGKIGIIDLKPRHPEMDAWAKRFKWPVTPRYPIPYVTRLKHLGYDLNTFVYRPPHGSEISEEADVLLGWKVFRFAQSAYKSKDPWIIDADEMLDLEDLGGPRPKPPMKVLMRVLHTRGRSNLTGFWGGTQRPYDVSLYAYSQASHLFICRDTDKNNHRRYRDIGGIDPVIVAETVSNLPEYHWLYLRPAKGQACVVGP